MSDTPNPQQAKPKPGQKRIAIDIPKELTAVYANLAFISHTPGEIVLDFAQVLPRMPRGRVSLGKSGSPPTWPINFSVFRSKGETKTKILTK